MHPVRLVWGPSQIVILPLVGDCSSRPGAHLLEACLCLQRDRFKCPSHCRRLQWRRALRQSLRCLLNVPQTHIDATTFAVPYKLKLDVESCALAIQGQHAMAKLETALAFVSTLGGGYYLTYHHGKAVQAAVLQMALAVYVDDAPTVIRTWTHLAYVGSSCGCNRVAFWASRTAVSLCTILQLGNASESYRAARVCYRYVRKLAQARRKEAVALSDREAVHTKLHRLTDTELLSRIYSAFVRFLPLPSVLGMCARTAREWRAAPGASTAFAQIQIHSPDETP